MSETFPQYPMREVTDVLKRGHRAAEKGHICFKEFVHAEPQGNNDSEIRKKKITVITKVL